MHKPLGHWWQHWACMALNGRGKRHKQGPMVFSSGRMMVLSRRIGALGIVKEFTAISHWFWLVWPSKQPKAESRFLTFARKSQPTEVALRNGLRSDTTNAFPCVNTKPDWCICGVAVMVLLQLVMAIVLFSQVLVQFCQWDRWGSWPSSCVFLGFERSAQKGTIFWIWELWELGLGLDPLVLQLHCPSGSTHTALCCRGKSNSSS
jgi:hypothetical protein